MRKGVQARQAQAAKAMKLVIYMPNIALFAL